MVKRRIAATTDSDNRRAKQTVERFCDLVTKVELKDRYALENSGLCIVRKINSTSVYFYIASFEDRDAVYDNEINVKNTEIVRAESEGHQAWLELVNKTRNKLLAGHTKAVKSPTRVVSGTGDLDQKEVIDSFADLVTALEYSDRDSLRDRDLDIVYRVLRGSVYFYLDNSDNTDVVFDRGIKVKNSEILSAHNSSYRDWCNLIATTQAYLLNGIRSAVVHPVKSTLVVTPKSIKAASSAGFDHLTREIQDVYKRARAGRVAVTVTGLGEAAKVAIRMGDGSTLVLNALSAEELIHDIGWDDQYSANFIVEELKFRGDYVESSSDVMSATVGEDTPEPDANLLKQEVDQMDRFIERVLEYIDEDLADVDVSVTAKIKGSSVFFHVYTDKELGSVEVPLGDIETSTSWVEMGGEIIDEIWALFSNKPDKEQNEDVESCDAIMSSDNLGLEPLCNEIRDIFQRAGKGKVKVRVNQTPYETKIQIGPYDGKVILVDPIAADHIVQDNEWGYPDDALFVVDELESSTLYERNVLID